MIRPEEKRPEQQMEVALPAAYMEQVRTHAKELDDSTPGYVIRAIVMDYFDSGRDKGNAASEKPKAARSVRPKGEAKSKAVAMPQRGKAVA